MAEGGVSGERVLVLEDEYEYHVAADLRQVLEDASAAVIGPAACLADAIALAEGQLDTRLRGVAAFAAAGNLAVPQ